MTISSIAAQTIPAKAPVAPTPAPTTKVADRKNDVDSDDKASAAPPPKAPPPGQGTQLDFLA